MKKIIYAINWCIIPFKMLNNKYDHDLWRKRTKDRERKEEDGEKEKGKEEEQVGPLSSLSCLSSIFS